VPLRDISGDLLSLQLINSAGEKRYLKDGRTFACFALVGEQAISAHGDLYIAEGWATAATVYKSLQIPVVAAMNAGNLKPVAQAIRGKFPGLAIVIAADNDWKTLGNPGLVKARQAAAAVGACVTCPSVCMRDGCTCTDFNDLEYCRGLEK
jgi:putative DNA primase/helicase